MKRSLEALAGGVAVFTWLLGDQPTAGAYDWQPPTNKITLLAVSAHQDDEGVFFGGALPYYSSVLNLPTMVLCMTGGRDAVRDEELRCAAWTYGLRYEPLFGHFVSFLSSWLTNNPYTNNIDVSWDVWADGVFQGDGSDLEAGKARAINYVAEQIRRYRPDVIITHDLNGETGHNEHKATAYAVTRAFFVAADPTATATNLVGLPPWQAKKLYMHVYPINRIFHEFWETPYPALTNLTPHQVVNTGLTCHVSQGPSRWICASVYPPSGMYSSWPSEWWGLYASMVGPDTVSSSNLVVHGYMVASGVAAGDFLEHVSLAPLLQPVSFAANPLVLPGGVASNSYTGQTLANYLNSTDPIWALTFGKISGPAWLSVAADGTLSGTPARSDAGMNSWEVVVTNQLGQIAQTTLSIRVWGEDLMGWWRLNETNPASRLASNSVPVTPDGISYGGSVFDQEGPRPWARYAVQFNGIDGKEDVPYSAALNPPVFTVALWANVMGGNGTYRSPLTSRASQPQSGYIFYAGPDNLWQFWMGDGSAWNALTAGPVVNNTWIHLAATYDGTTACFYANGSLAATARVAFRRNDTFPLRIGAGATEGAGAYWFPGRVDDVRVYRVALDAAHVWALCADPPVISDITAQSVSVTVGCNAAFSVAATGTVPLSYQWRYNGANIGGATTSSYTLSNVQPADAGSYSVVVSNIAGTVTNSDAVLTINVAPTITTQPQDQNVNQSGNAVLTVVATGTPSPSYQWRFDGTNIDGATGTSLTVANAQPADAGSYSVVVSNIAGAVTSADAVLTVTVPTVNVAPTITTQPQDQNVNQSGNAVFTVAATGTPSPSYQWRFDGTNIDGATGTSLTVANAQPANAGSYSVVVSNIAGAVTSAPPTVLTVVDTTAPAITPAGNKTVECTAAWTFDTPSVTDSSGTATLTVLSTTTNWTCGAAYVATRAWRAVDAFGNSATCTQVVTVVDTTPPLILCPSNLTVACSSPWSFGTPVAADRGLGGAVVYDNSVNDLVTRFDAGTNEVGNEIILGGEGRYLEGFSYEFWSTNLTGSPLFEGTNVAVRLRFYANDGPNFNDYPTPGTLLYDSGEFGLGAGTTPRATVIYDEFDLWLYALYPLMDALPSNITWTVQFSGLGTNDQAGVDLYSPPVIGQSYGDFWLRTNGGWQLRMIPGVAMDIAARATASTNRVAITVLSTVTNAIPGSGLVVTRTWRATDACGNFSDCSQTVTLGDTTAPVITYCPTNRSLIVGTHCLVVLPDFTGELIATDACSQVSVSQSPAVGTAVGLGEQLVIFTVRDAASNSTTCVLTLAVVLPDGANTNSSVVANISRRSDGAVRVDFTGFPCASYTVQSSTNLVDWERIGVAGDHGDGMFSFEDAYAARFPNRFYRIVLP